MREEEPSETGPKRKTGPKRFNQKSQTGMA
ncbi:BnaA05g34720D [Brassica napus]|uniref:BnaA05g34720D protein n=1 Tax=Brassica napus TaxID=3708 RepID=A0A078IW35_BRANA|nr:BnaA05g34720D [Brassica napus]